MRPVYSTLSILAFALFLCVWTALADPTASFERSANNSHRLRARSLNFHETTDGHVSSYHATPRVLRHRRELARKYREKREAKRDSLRRREPIAPRPLEYGVPFRPPPVRSTPEHHQYKKAKRARDLTGGVHSSLTARQSNVACDDATTVPPSFDGSCTASTPCPNGACCSDNGFCGYGEMFCGSGCLSNCDAKAECGPNAAPGNETCPLNVCCSQFGFCGTTDEFCGTGCAPPNCGSPTIPSGQNGPVTSRVIGYYEGWASTRSCDAWYPENILAQGYTHLNYAFASIDPTSFKIVPASAEDVAQYTNFTNLKQINPNLKTFISVGGWSFNDPPTQNVFSDTAASAANRLTFANSLVAFMLQYGFDGVDVDWEYPGACDRGGNPADLQNYPLLLSTIRSVFDASGHTFGISFTAPSSFWYLQNFDLPALLESADWINLMTYDLHGVWDEKDVYIGSIVQAHTNLTEIKQSVQLFLRVDVPLDRVVLGLGFYGRSFALSDPSCTTPGCPFSGPAPAGPCTNSAGILSYSEIQNILSSTNATPVQDTDAAVMYLVYGDGGSDWISYDDNATFVTKVNFAKDAGFGGLMVWAADLDTFSGQALEAILGVDPSSLQIPAANDVNSKDAQACVQMDCGQTCPSGYIQMTDVTDGELANPKSGCSGGLGRPVCCPVNSIPQNCQWRGTAPVCNGVCQVGEITLATDSWGTGKKCSSGHKAFCCQSGLTEEEINDSTDCSCCNDNVCPTGTFTKDRSYYGDTNIFHACFMQEKSYCCYPPGNISTNAPFDVDDLFPNPPADGDLTWDEQDEMLDENPPAGGQGPDDDAFGLIAMDGPSNMLSSVDAASDWVVSGCQNAGVYQIVTAFCSKLESDPSSGCNAVFEGNAENTVVKMPSGCGGPYARLAVLQVNNSLALPTSLLAQKPDENPIYEMHFDYDFSRLAETRSADVDGDVLVRVDATDIPFYWSEIDTADPNSPVKRGVIEERWFGGFSDWLARLNKVEAESSSDLFITKSFSQTLFSASQTCSSADGSTNFMASIDLTASGSANFHLKYGFYLEGTLVNLNINQAYVYASSDASAQAGIVLSGRATVDYTSGRVPIIPQISWPGLSFAGIVTIGPTFNIYGLLTGMVSASGTFAIQTSYTFPSGHVAWGIFGDSGGSPDDGMSGQVMTIPSTFQVTPQYDIQLGGSLAIHVIPEADLGISVLGYSAQAYVSADAALNLDFSVDTSAASISVDGTIDFAGGVYQMAKTTRTDLIGPFHFYQNSWNIYKYSLPFGSTQDALELPFNSTSFDSLDFIETYPVYHGPQKRAGLSGILGSLTCPSTSNENTDFSAELADDDTNLDDDDVASELTRRSLEVDASPVDESLVPGNILVTTGCSGCTITPPPYKGLGNNQYYDLQFPLSANDVSVAAWGAPQQWAKINPNTGSMTTGKSTGYGLEHVYEAQLLVVFISDVLQNNVNFQAAGFPSFCTWLKFFVWTDQFGYGVTYSNKLMNTLPSSGNQFISSMPLLNQISNQAKAAFIVQGKRLFRKQSTLAAKKPATVVYLMRQAGLSIDYMNQLFIKRSFYAVGEQVRRIWIQFFADYNLWLQSRGLPTLQIDVSTLYINWINANLNAYNTQARSFLQTANGVLQNMLASPPAVNGQLTIQVPLYGAAQTVTINQAFAIQYGNVWTNYDPNNIP